MLKSPDPDFCPFANHLPASFLNIFESISDLKVICAQSWGHLEALWGPRSPKTSLQQHFSWVHYGLDTLYNVSSLEWVSISITIPSHIPMSLTNCRRDENFSYLLNILAFVKLSGKMFNICAKPAQYLSGQLKNSYLETSLLCTLLQGIAPTFLFQMNAF